MNKHEFLEKLKHELRGLPKDDIIERLTFYSEMIDDRMEEGLTEADAIKELGSIDDIVMQIKSEIPLVKLVKEKIKPNRTLRVWEIILIVLGSPIWLSLLIAAFAVVFSLYAVLWSVTVALWAIGAAFAGCFIGGSCSAVFFTLQGNVIPGVAVLGLGLLCGGLSILCLHVCKSTTLGILRLTRLIFVWIKSLFIGKDRSK